MNYLNPKFADLSFSELLRLAQPRSSSTPAGLSAAALPNEGAKITPTDPVLKSISFGRPSRRTTTVPSGSSGSRILASVASSLFGGSLIGSLASLFGSSSGQTIQTLSLFQLPESTNATLVAGSTSESQQSPQTRSPISLPQGSSYASGVLMGLKSLTGANAAGSNTSTLMPGSAHTQNNRSRGYNAGIQGAPMSLAPSRGGGSPAVSGHQIHVHVSALDTQSFLDRSSQIAQAVRTAMLQSHSLNDVIAEM